ncbi:MAG: AGE family epimerase/isomerase [Propioniciclava sp.]
MTPGTSADRAIQRSELLRFAANSRHPAGFGHLDSTGKLDPTQPVELYVTCRMTHTFALGLLAADPPAPHGPDADTLRSLAQQGVQALLEGPLHDPEHGGWFARVNTDNTTAPLKEAYGHAHVVLAASSALAGGIHRAAELLEQALTVQSERFFDVDAGLVVEEWDPAWRQLSEYRGMNSNMHTVECYLAAGDVTGDPQWHTKAGRMATRLVSWASANDWRIPEHFTADWTPMMDYNLEQPAHPFRPYGATIGHGLEWARLLIQVHASLGAAAPAGLQEAGIALADRAISDGWHADGADGFVYTTDWEGRPIVRSRMHWVICEAIATSAILSQVTGDPRHDSDLHRWWDYADEFLVDHHAGSWHHELGPDNRPQSRTWAGKPDAYHTYQALLVQDLPVVPSFATALRHA